MPKKINFGKLLRKLETEKDRIAFLQKYGILHTSIQCSDCDKTIVDVKSNSKSNYFFFNCKDCRKKYSIRSNSILSNANISLRKLILLVYIFVSNFWTYKQIQVSEYFSNNRVNRRVSPNIRINY